MLKGIFVTCFKCVNIYGNGIIIVNGCHKVRSYIVSGICQLV